MVASGYPQGRQIARSEGAVETQSSGCGNSTSAKRHFPVAIGAVSQGVRLAVQWLSDAAVSARDRLQSITRSKVKVRVALSPRQAVEAAGASFSLLLIVVGFTLFEVWHQERFRVVAATPSFEQDSGARSNPLRQLPVLQASHQQITDPATLSFVLGLSRYEVHALQRQAYFGDDSAALAMGMLYETGHYVPQSCTKAADWVTRSAYWGNAAAQYNLGLRYRGGDGVPVSDDQALQWLQKAADQRYSLARSALETLASGNVDSMNSR